MGVHKLMKTTTYSIGKKGLDAPNEKFSSNQTYHTADVHVEDSPPKFDKNSRRADPANANRVLTVGFGFGAEKGTKDQQTDFRTKTFYGTAHGGSAQPDMNPNMSHLINKDRGSFNLSSKFQYGSDANGGAKSGKVPDDPKQFQECIQQSVAGHGKREEFKEKIERQNFTIQHDKQLTNSDTKYIGTHGGKGISNIIDIDDLKRSHLPIKEEKASADPMSAYRSYQNQYVGGRATQGM